MSLNSFYLITLFLLMLLKRLQGLLIKSDKFFIFFFKTYFAMVFWLIKYVFTNSVNIRFWYWKGGSRFCQENWLLQSLFLFIKFWELLATTEARSSSDNFGERDTRKWTCSGLAYIEYDWESLLFTMPVMYFSIRSRYFSEISGMRRRVEKIKWVYKLLYSIFILF